MTNSLKIVKFVFFSLLNLKYFSHVTRPINLKYNKSLVSHSIKLLIFLAAQTSIFCRLLTNTVELDIGMSTVHNLPVYTPSFSEYSLIFPWSLLLMFYALISHEISKSHFLFSLSSFLSSFISLLIPPKILSPLFSLL